MHASPARPLSDPRRNAARLLARWKQHDEFPDREMDRLSADHGATLEWVQGVLRWRRPLERLLHELAEHTPPPLLEAFALLGLFQIFFQPQVPDHAAVHETVESCKLECGQRGANFVNALLRRALREEPALRRLLREQPPAVQWSHPDRLVERWTNRWGAEAVGRLCVFNNEPAQTVLCVCRSRVSVEAFRAALQSAGLDATPHPAAPDRYLVLPRGRKVSDVPGYTEGWFVVQDPAAAAALDVMDVRPGQSILDACAAPGGKAILLADALRDEGLVLALDRYEDRLGRLRENQQRLKFDTLRIGSADARQATSLGRVIRAAGAPDLFDRVLLDVPCSNTGVIRRKPDIRWRFSEQRLDRLILTQRQILEACAARVKPGGRLVYSTCSLEREENEDMIRGWLRQHPRFKLVDERTIFPPDAGTDGAYAAAVALNHPPRARK
jgi:16S rRNA (cytosine967-C5)-methyltransferase